MRKFVFILRLGSFTNLLAHRYYPIIPDITNTVESMQYIDDNVTFVITGNAGWYCSTADIDYGAG